MDDEWKRAFGRRMDAALDEHPESAAALARKYGKSRSWLANWRSGTNVPGADDLALICRELGKSADELLGLPLRYGPAVTSDGEYIEVPVLAAPVSAGAGLDISAAEMADPHRLRADWVRQHIRGTPYRMRVSPSHSHGQSMVNTILPGAMLTVDVRDFRTNDIRPGAIYLILDDDGFAMVKRLFPIAADHMLLCQSDNLAFPPFPIHPSAAGSFARVLGHVVRWEQGET